jgi:hypothetical protein
MLDVLRRILGAARLESAVERDHGALVARQAQALLDYLDFKPVEERCAAGVLRQASSGRAPGLEGGEALADIDGRPQFAVYAVDPRVEPADFGDQLGPQGIDLRRQSGVDVVDLLVEGDDSLVEHADLAAEPLEFRGHDVLKRLLDLVVDAHRTHSIRPFP